MLNQRCCISGPFTVVMETSELPPLQPGQVLARTCYSLISPGTELAMYTHSHVGFSDPNNKFAKYPFYPGYAGVGEVVAAGEGARFAPGDRLFYRSPHQQYTVLTPERENVQPAPTGIPATWAPFARMAQISNTARYLAEAGPGQRVVVLGLGLVGNLAAQVYAIAGARVIGIDLEAARCALAERCGIAQVVRAGQDDTVEVVRAMTDGQGADIVVEATGNSALVPLALKMARIKGQVILLGSPRGTVDLDIYNLIHRTGVCLRGAHEMLCPVVAGPGEVDQRAVTREMLGYLESGRLVVEPLISTIAAPTELNDCYQSLLHRKDAALGVLLHWDHA